MKGSPRWPAGRKEGAPCFGFPLEVADESMAVVVALPQGCAMSARLKVAALGQCRLSRLYK